MGGGVPNAEPGGAARFGPESKLEPLKRRRRAEGTGKRRWGRLEVGEGFRV